MRLALSSILVASASLAGVAAAEPVTQDACTVNIAHAPADVRDVVETWVRGESHCHGELEVRIVPTDGGFYLFARDTSGRVRERIVPDAKSAGVLVASWAADDSIEPPPPPPPAIVPPPPSPAPPVETLGLIVPSERHVMLGLGAMVGNVYGLRTELDMTRFRRFLFGLSVGITTASIATSDGPLTMRDMSAMAYVAMQFQAGRFWLRPQVGLGGITSEFNKFVTSSGMEEATGGDNAAMFEASARVGADLGPWCVSAGPIARMYTETWDANGYGTLLNRNGDVSMYFGFGRKL